MVGVSRCPNCGRLQAGISKPVMCLNCWWHAANHEDSHYDPHCPQCVVEAMEAKFVALRIVAWRFWLILRRALRKG